MSQFAGRVALVTGGNSGIGRATALAFARAGAQVVISGRREHEGHEVVEEIEALGAAGHFVAADVSREADVAALIASAVATFGRIDVAFNNAGLEQLSTPLAEQTEETFDRIMAVNVKGTWLSLKHEIPAMLKTGGGAIVNTSSIAGVVGFAEVPIYVASKHAVIGLTQSVALEYAARGVRVNAVAPAAVDTRMFRDFASTEDMRKTLAAAHPSGASASPRRSPRRSCGSAPPARRSSPARRW